MDCHHLLIIRSYGMKISNPVRKIQLKDKKNGERRSRHKKLVDQLPIPYVKIQ